MTNIKITFFFSLFFFLCNLTKAQETIDYPYIETKTSQLYFASQWDSLIYIGQQGIDNNIDYFYLRLRIGIAYYYQEKYSKAIIHLEKAQKMNPQDEYTNSFLYLSYKYIGRDLDAEVTGMKLSDSLRKSELYKKTPFFSSLYLELGATSEGSYTPVAIPKKSPITKETSNKINSLQYDFLGLTNQITPWLSIFYGYSNLSSSYTNYTYQKFTHPTFIKETKTEVPINQQQLYFNSKIRISKGFVFHPYFHSITTKTNLSNFSYSGDSTIVFKDYILGGGVFKQVKNVEIGLEFSKNKMNNKNRLQLIAGLIWYPLSNKKIYFGSNITFLNGKKDMAAKKGNNSINYYLTGKIGGKILKNIWAETTLYSGNIQNSHIGSGFIFFNSPNKYNFMSNTTLFFLFKKVTLTIRYQYSSLKGIIEATNIYNETINSEFSFNKHTITGGLLWKF